MNNNPILKLIDIDKKFPGVHALKKVNFELNKGETHALVGENGAGKSTLIKILAGIHQPNGGSIVLKDKVCDFKTPKIAEMNGISVVHQELSIFGYMSIAENIFAGRAPRKGLFIDYKTLYNKSRELIKRFELDKYLDVKQKMGDLNLARQQIIEIIRAVAQDAQIIVFDEPTSALTDYETRILFDIIGELKRSGISIIYISHRLDEIFGLADRVTVLKDGEYVKTLNVCDTSKDEIIRLMVGRDVENDYEVGTSEIKESILEVKNFCDGGKHVKDVSFKLHRGEILGIGGLEGAGRTELVEMIFGLRKKTNGEVLIRNKEASIKKPVDAIEHGMAYITKDRKDLGLFIELDVLHNTAAVAMRRFIKNGVIDFRSMKKSADKYIKEFDIRTPSVEQKLLYLSGGNQQKVLLAMWLTNEPEIIIVDEPTRGVDVGAKREIHRILRQLAREGKAIIMISSDLPELLAASDNVIVMYEGLVTGSFNYKEITEEAVMRKASNH